jgi:hypothetical protein
MPLYFSKGLDKSMLETRRNRTINAEIPYQFQEHEETLLYQICSTKIPRKILPRDNALDILTNRQSTSIQETFKRDRAKCPSRAKISAIKYVILKSVMSK